MPFLETDDYRAPWLLAQRDLATILPALMRRVPGINYQRTRIETPDNDFVDLDIPKENPGSRTLGLVLHGLEGNSGSPYMPGMCQSLNRMGIDAAALNHCNCSGEPNRNFRSYNSAHTDDLRTVLGWIEQQKRWDRVVLIGFSLGGVITLKYLGERDGEVSPLVVGGLAIATPCDVVDSCHQLQRPRNRMYLWWFLRTLRKKALEKLERHPDEANFTVDDIRKVRNFIDYDNLYTAPAHGFKDAYDYYNTASSLNYIPAIKVPTLLLNAQNDPFLTPTCFPFGLTRDHAYVHFMAPRYGGHVGFANSTRLAGEFWMEQKARWFLQHILGESVSELAPSDAQIRIPTEQ